MRFRGAIGVAALLALGLPAAAHAGSLVVIGGGLEDPAIYDEIVRLGGGPGVARIGILTTGSGTPEKNGRFYLDAFAAHGAEAEWIPLEIGDPKRANDPALVAQARGCNVFFLGGGDQQRYTATLLRKDGSDTALLAAIRQAFEAGGVVAGTSAGAAALVEGPMVTGGESYEALGRASGVSDRQRGGLRFFRFGLIDTHFAERGRQGRLIRLAARRRVGLAFGVDEDAALVVEDAQGQRPRMRVVGSGGVSVFDLSSARAPARGRWSIRNAIGHYLTAGDSFDATTRRVRIGHGKRRDRSRLVGSRADREDIFSAVDRSKGRRNRPRAFLRQAMAVFSPGARAATAHPSGDPSWRVELARGRRGARYRSRSGQRSFKNLRVDIRRGR
jgi:cyanophycinase